MNFLEIAKSQPVVIEKQPVKKTRKSKLENDPRTPLIIKDYTEGILTVNEIIKKYKIKYKNYQKIMKKHNIPIRESLRNIKFDTNYFENIDTSDKSYFLGFITADGYINDNYIGLEISRTDLEILEEFKKCLNSEHQIYFRERINPKIQKNYSKVCELRLCSRKMVSDLTKHGLDKNKSFLCKVPNLNDSLMPHYLRGLIDGDGSWYYTGKDRAIKQLCFFFCSSCETFINDIQSLLIERCNLHSKTQILSREDKYFSLRYQGNEQCARIFNYLYKVKGPYLSRKYLKVVDHLKDINLLDIELQTYNLK